MPRTESGPDISRTVDSDVNDAAAASPALPYRWVILGVGILGYAATLFARQNYSGVQKFIAADLHLDKAALGLLGSVFFYSYTFFQMPWGVASDKLGSRAVTGVGVLLVAATMVGFASGRTEAQLLFWRAASGIAGAAVYVAMTGGVARWFPQHERGLSQTTLGGVGGALGECTAFFVLPAMSIYIATGWRQATDMVAAVLALIGVLCLVLLRSAPPNRPATTRKPFDAALLRDPQLWAYTFLYSGFIMAIRIVQPWIAVYAADMYFAHGLDVKAAVLNGGLLAVVAYSLLGRGVGCPLAGRASDVALQAGFSLYERRHVVARGRGGPARHVIGRHEHRVVAGDHGVPARHLHQLVFVDHGVDFRYIRSSADGVDRLVHEHGRPVRRRDGTRAQRLYRHFVECAGRQLARRVSRHLAVGHDRRRRDGHRRRSDALACRRIGSCQYFSVVHLRIARC